MALGAPRGCMGLFWGIRRCRGVLGASMDYRYSGARRDIGALVGS